MDPCVLLVYCGSVICYFMLSLPTVLTDSKPLKEFTIGGLFSDEESMHRSAFTFAVEVANASLAPSGLSLVPMWRNIPPRDAFAAAQSACDMLMSKSVALFGPNSHPSIAQIQSLADSKEVPHFALNMTSSHSTFGGSFGLENNPHSSTINLFPPRDSIGKALAALVNHFQWNAFVLLYQDDAGLLQLQHLLDLSSYDFMIVMRKLPQSSDFRPLLKEIKEVIMQSKLIIQANLMTSLQILQQAVGEKLISEYYHFIFTELDMYTLDVEPYKTSCRNCNITTLRFVQMNNITADARSKLEKVTPKFVPKFGLYTSVAVTIDSVMLLAKTLNSSRNLIVPDSVSCSSKQTLNGGLSLINEIKMNNYTGTTGEVTLDSFGSRESYRYYLLELTKSGFTELGVFDNKHGLTITQNYTKALAGYQSLINKTLNVTVILEEPFVMLVNADDAKSGNAMYEGYCIDLLNEISKILNFTFKIQVVKDGSYGVKEKGVWDGVVGELVRGEADMAVASLTISYSRSSAIDFTVPFMHLGISILFKKPEKKDPSLFTFLSPLSLDVWVYMLATYLGVSLMLWILARFSPYEWYNPHPCNDDSDIVENQFTLLNSLWFTVGSLMQQGCEVAPRAVSTRMVAGFWWFFTLILISSYTANLAAFLTVERMVSPIESADDLAKQIQIKYGSLNRGSTMTFFKESKIQTYERMWAFMESTQPSVFVNSSSEGIARVRAGNYAYLMESSMLEYTIERQCELMQIGGLLDSKGYGIGLPKGSPYREPISSAILMLQEKTKLTALKEKWWKRERGGGKCKGIDEHKGKANELGLPNVGGVFVFLLCGLCLSFIIAIMEFVYKTSQRKIGKRSILREMWKELKFAFRCKGSKKPIAKKHPRDQTPAYLLNGTSGGAVDKPSRKYWDSKYDPVPTQPDFNNK